MAFSEAEQLAPLFARLLSLPLLVLIWQLVCNLEWVNPLPFSAPLTVFCALFDYLYQGSGWLDLAWSLLRVVVGYVLGAVVGIAMGLLTDTRPILNGLLTPIFQVLRPIPPIAFVPLVVLWFGLGKAANTSWCSGVCFSLYGWPPTLGCSGSMCT